MWFTFHPSDVDLSLGTPVERKPRQLLSPRMYLLRKCSAKRGLEDSRGGDFVEGKIIDGAAGALLPVEEEAAVAVCEAGGGIKRQKQ